MTRFHKGDIVYLRSDNPFAVEYSRWFGGHMGPFRVARRARDTDWSVYVSKLDGTYWLDDAGYSTILTEYLRPDTFMNAVREAVQQGGE
jgi:hypothetical protein